MKNRVSLTIVMLSLFCSPAISRAQTSAGGASKIGLLNIQQAIAQTAEGKKALADLDAKYAPKRDELQKLNQDVLSLEDQLQRQATTLSDDERLRLTREHDEKKKIFDRTQQDARDDFQADNQEIGRRIGQKMVPIINQYAQQNGYAIVLDPAAAQVPVYFVAKGVDIVDDIVRLYDAANPVTASAATGVKASPTRTASRAATTPKSSGKSQ